MQLITDLRVNVDHNARKGGETGFILSTRAENER